MIRIYVPRSERELAEGYDVAIFEDFTPDVMSIEQIDWFQRSVERGWDSGRTYYRIVNEEGPLNLPGIESVALNAGHHDDITPRLDSTVPCGREEERRR